MILFDHYFDTLVDFGLYGMKVASEFGYGPMDSGHLFQYSDSWIALHVA